MKVFFLGISGTLMGNIALMAKELGHEVSGTDAKVYPPMSEKLIEAGINFSEGFIKENFEEADSYIIGNVISRNNELLQEILENDGLIQSSPDWLYQNILKEKKVIAVSGTHGKTTVTTLLAHALNKLELNPGHLIAGVPNGKLDSCKLGSGEYFVIEADEYDSAYFDKRPKFVHYRPEILLINNIEFDHGDIFSDIDAIEGQFQELIATLETESTVLICKTGVRKQFIEAIQTNPNIKCKVKFFEPNKDDIDSLNMSSAMAVIDHLKISISRERLFGDFQGIRRRFEVLFENDQYVLINDFAHHPTAIEKTLKKALLQNLEVNLIVEIGSNTMKSGYHDAKLKEIFNLTNTFLINASNDQLQTFNNCAELTADNVLDLLETDSKKKMFLMCGNKNFNGLQEMLLNALLDINL